jgi:7-cyano-7-deazaguanine synthase in queuosine biosynthesis
MHVTEVDTFSKLHIELLKQIPYHYSGDGSLIIDLVTLMGAIYCKDVQTPKPNEKPRYIEIDIPVFNIDIWREQTNLIENMVKWVSEDIYKFNFIETSYRQHDYATSILPPSQNEVTLFSGGLDSFSGAYHNYKNNIQSDYIGFINKDEEKTKQIQVAKFYKDVFVDSTEIILIDKPVQKKITYTQSTRSLLYLSLAISKAFFNSATNVYLYENGILSLNPEIKNRYTTKTTHPKTIYLYRLLLERLNINVLINHPFLFKTKGEIINDMDNNFKKVIKDTFTCGQGRSPIKSHTGQCGICIPCILRKISISAYENESFDDDYQYPYNIKINEIDDQFYRKDFISNLDYFNSYYLLIKSKKIHLHTQTRGKFYEGIPDFREKTNIMFEKFLMEYERFLEKYAPN